MIANSLKKNGYRIKKEKVYIPNPKLKDLFDAFNSLVFFSVSLSLFLHSYAITFLFILLFAFIKKYDAKIKIGISKIESENIFAASKTTHKKKMLITTHYDSAQIMHSWLRKNYGYAELLSNALKIFQFFTGILIILIISNSLINFTSMKNFQTLDVLWFIAAILLFAVFMIRIIFFIFQKKKYVVGADDNATGVALSLFFAEFLKNKKLNLDVGFLFFCGEEQGMLGSADWVKKHFSETKTTTVLNLDTLGRGKYFVINRGWNYFRKIKMDNAVAKILESDIDKEKYFETWNLFSDAYPFAQKNFKVFSIIRMDKKEFNSIEKLLMILFSIDRTQLFRTSAKWVHNADDIYEKINFVKLNESKSLVLNLIKNIDNKL